MDTQNTQQTKAQTDNSFSAQKILEQTENYLPVDEHVEVVSEDGKPISRKGIYLLPNMLTTAAMFCGFYAIISSINGLYEQAIFAIFAAGFFDMLDGRVARLLNASSAFGVEYDSLSDLISFGAAPAILAFSWGLGSLGKLGGVLAFIYLCCAALRLARFNTQAGEEANNFFAGLASPAAAGWLTSFVWLMYDYGIEANMLGGFLTACLSLVTFLAALLMVSNLPYYSFKNISLKGRVPFAMLLVFIFFAMLIATDPPTFLFGFGLIYAASGIVLYVYRKLNPDAVNNGESA